MVGAQASRQRLGRPVRARHMAARDGSGGQNPGSKGPGLGPERACPEPLGSWSPGRDRGRELPAVGAVPGCWLSLGVYFLIHLFFFPSLHPHGLAPILTGLCSLGYEPLAFPAGCRAAAKGMVSPASGWRSSRLGASKGPQTRQVPDSSCLLPVPGGQGLSPRLHQAWQEAWDRNPHQGYRGTWPPS